jgi:peptide/nickel transport system substrate-binding protein
MFTSEFPWDPKVAGPKYDLDAAKRLVQEAKAAGWNGQLSFVTVNTPQGNAVGLAIEAQLKAAGIDVRLESKESTLHQQQVISLKNFELTVWGTSAGPDDSALWALAQNFLSTSASNRVGFKSTIVDQALKDIRVAKTNDEKRAAYGKVAQEIAAQLPIYVFTATEEYRIYNSKVHGLAPGNKSYVFFDKAWVER